MEDVLRAYGLTKTDYERTKKYVFRHLKLAHGR